MTPVRRLKVSVCHAEPVVRAGLAALLSGCSDMEVATGAPPVPKWADVIVTDFSDAVLRLRASAAERIMIVTQREREWDVRTALAAGVHAYIPQRVAAVEVPVAVRALAAGQRHYSEPLLARATANVYRGEFTARESDVLRLLALGCSNKQIALGLDIEVGTVKTHVKSLFSKLGAKDRTHALVLATRRGIVS